MKKKQLNESNKARKNFITGDWMILGRLGLALLIKDAGWKQMKAATITEKSKADGRIENLRKKIEIIHECRHW